MKLKEAFLSKYRSDKIFLAEWLLVLVTGLFVFFSICYVDMQSLTIWSTNVWDVIVDSNIRHLYEYSAQNIYDVQHQYMGSELMSVLPWSIWNLPIWAVQRFFGKPIIDSPIMMAYSKLFLVLLSAVVLIYTKKITQIITGDSTKSAWAVFLTASSLYLYISVWYAGQNDIIMITASVVAVYCLLKNKSIAFIAWSMLAISIKPFFILPFVAVVLLYEKNIFKIILKAFFGVFGLLVQKILFKGAPMYAESLELGPAKTMLADMFPGNLSTSFGKVSFLAIFLVIIYLYSYSRNFNIQSLKDNAQEFGKYVIYLITATYMCYIMFSPLTFYRVGVLIPFVYILIIQNERLYFYNIILDFVMSFTLLAKLTLRQDSSLFRLKSVNKSLFQQLLGYRVDYTKAGYYTSLDTFLYEKNDLIDEFQPLFSGIALVCGALIILLNHPNERIKLPVSGDKNCRALLWLRTLMIVPGVLLLLYFFVNSQNRIY